MNTFKINLIRVVLIILLVFTFLNIFFFSNQNGQESGNLSRKITEILTKNIKYIQHLEENKKEEVLTKIEGVIRKIAHLSIYTVVGILLMGLISTYEIKESNRIIISFIIGALYSCTDEIHQAFIPNRSAQITDVIIDSIGVMLGILCVLLIIKIVNKILCKKSKQNLVEQENIK